MRFAAPHIFNVAKACKASFSLTGEISTKVSSGSSRGLRARSAIISLAMELLR
jgi:hypothetical protein